jgi:hypothetical protein
VNTCCIGHKSCVLQGHGGLVDKPSQHVLNRFARGKKKRQQANLQAQEQSSTQSAKFPLSPLAECSTKSTIALALQEVAKADEREGGRSLDEPDEMKQTSELPSEARGAIPYDTERSFDMAIRAKPRKRRLQQDPAFL